ncbi:MAG: carboxypeptidase-like regulatory domain-containing protein [Bacteroidales bacterium]|nr:carboxypeptidase-like regulatory domain-containing protein [Bacteroidales bacterium]
MGKADIYHFVQPQQKIDVSGVIRNKRTNETMQGVTITLLDDSNFLIDEAISNEKGEYVIKLEKDKKYILYVSYKNYQFERYNIDTDNLIEDMHFTRDFFLVN